MMMRLVAKSANESMNMQTRPTHLSHPYNPLPIPDSLFLQLSKEESQKHVSIELTSLPLSPCGPLARPIHPSTIRPSVPASFVPHPLAASQAIVSSSFPFRSCFLPALGLSFCVFLSHSCSSSQSNRSDQSAIVCVAPSRKSERGRPRGRNKRGKVENAECTVQKRMFFPRLCLIWMQMQWDPFSVVKTTSFTWMSLH